jgi:hypothetical protein
MESFSSSLMTFRLSNSGETGRHHGSIGSGLYREKNNQLSCFLVKGKRTIDFNVDASDWGLDYETRAKA